jgi:hypothetical protein
LAFIPASLATRIRALALPLIAAVCLAACGSGSSGGNGPATSSPPAPTPAPTPPANAAPQISGTPATSTKVGQPYDFSPQASDANGDTLRFEIVGRPSWATFDPNTGRLYGTPAAAGSFAGIAILVTDGQATASLPAFSIDVTEIVGTGSAQLSWTKPTTNTDGTPLSDLAGYRIYYGRLPDAPSDQLQVANPDATSAAINGLSSGTWYFSIASYTTACVESERTKPVWTSI